MGVVKIWNVDKVADPKVGYRATLKAQISDHRTGINDMWYGLGQLWTASTDCTVIVHDINSTGPSIKPHRPLELRKPVKAILPLSLTPVNEPILVVGSGEVISSYDVSLFDEPEQKGGIDGHWHDVTALRLWVKEANTPSGYEPMVVSASLDGTARIWTLKEVLLPLHTPAQSERSQLENKVTISGISEAELDELLETDEE